MSDGVMPADDLVFPGPGEDVLAAAAGGVGGAGVGAGVVGAPAQPAVGGNRPALRWTDAMSGFILRRFCQLISTGVRTDKGFKEVHLNQVAKALQEFSGHEVTSTQVYNHLRKWRQRYVKVTKLRDLSGASWNEETSMIVLEEEHYNGHVKDHPKDAEFLNKPIHNYKEMLIIFGNGQATGRFAVGSTEPLGVPTDFGESSQNANEDLKNGNTDTAEGKLEGGPYGKRKRSLLSDEDVVVFQGLNEAVKDVADAIRSTKVEDFHPDLYGAVMFIPGFTEEALMCAYGHLLDNKAQGTAFVGMTESHRILWLRTYLAKHYNM